MRTKWIAAFLCLCLGISLCSGAWAATGDALLYPPQPDGSYTNSPQTIIGVGDTLYLLSYNGLYSWHVGETEPTLVSDQVNNNYPGMKWSDMTPEDQEANKNCVNLLLQNGGKLYGLNLVKGSLLSLDVTAEGLNFTETATFAWDDMFVQEGDYSYTRQVYSAVLTDSTLYLLVQRNDGTWENYDLLAFDLATGAQTVIPAENVHAIAPYENGQLLCNVYDQQTMYTSDGQQLMPALSTLDLATQTITKLADFPAPQVGGLNYDAASGRVYVLGQGQLFAYTKESGVFETVSYLPVDYPNDQIPSAILSSGFYAALPNYGSVFVRNTDPALKADRVLRVAGGYSDTATQTFQAAHPEIPILFTDQFFGSAEDISQNMVSGSDSADLFIISLTYGGFTSLRDKGYVADLSQSAVLTQAVAKMYPDYVANLFKDGKLIAFPQSLNANLLGYSPELMAELGIAQPPKTISELLDLCVAWVDTYAQEYPSYTLMDSVYDIRSQLLSTIFMNYLAYYDKTGEPLTFDTPLFRSLLAKLDEVSPILEDLNPTEEEMQNGVVYSSSDGKPTSLLSNYLDAVPAEYGYDNGFRPLMLSLEDGMEPAILGQMQIFVLNPNSKNQDLALTYLEYLAQNMQHSLSIALCPDDNTPVENTYYLQNIAETNKQIEETKKQMETASPEDLKNLEANLKGLEENITWIEKDHWQISAETIAQYRALVPSISVNGEGLNLLYTSQEAVTLLQRYMDGQLSVDQFIGEFDRILQMIRMENQ